MSNRAETKSAISQLNLPKGTVAEIAGVSRSEISAFLYGHTISDRNCDKIKTAVEDLAQFVRIMEDQLGLRPDLRDIAAVRNGINGVKLAFAQAQLDAATEEARTEIENALSTM